MRDEVLVTVPNSMLNASKVINHSGPQRRRRLKAPISVGYGTDIDAFEELALAVADAEPLVLESPKPRMRFRSFGDSALEYELLCWVGSPMRVNKARHELNRTLYKRLGEAGIEIPYQKRDVRMVSGRADPTDAAAQPDGEAVTVEHDESVPGGPDDR